MNLKNARESTNWVDDTHQSLAQKMLSAIEIGFARHVYDPGGKQAALDKVQAARDANPLPHESQADIAASTVTRAADKKGYDIHRPGQTFGEYSPDMVPGIQDVLDSSNLPSKNTLSPQTLQVLQHAGLMKK